MLKEYMSQMYLPEMENGGEDLPEPLESEKA
jgi:hypothetical protein